MNEGVPGIGRNGRLQPTLADISRHQPTLFSRLQPTSSRFLSNVGWSRLDVGWSRLEKVGWCRPKSADVGCVGHSGRFQPPEWSTEIIRNIYSWKYFSNCSCSFRNIFKLSPQTKKTYQRFKKSFRFHFS